MSWIDGHDFGEDFVDLRGTDGAARADVLLDELRREVAPGHPLHGLACRVLAEALPQEEILVAAGEQVALVHLTWSAHHESPPWPSTELVESAATFRDLIAHRY